MYFEFVDFLFFYFIMRQHLCFIKVEIDYPGHIYYDILSNATLKALYRNNGKALGIQFPEQPGKFSGMCNWPHHLPESSKSCYHREFEMVWQGLRTLEMCHTSSPVSILSSTSVQMHWITLRSSQKQQVDSAGPSGNWEVVSDDSFQITDYLFAFLSCMPGAEKAQSFSLRTAKALAMTAVDVVCSPDLMTQVREDFRLAKLEGTTSLTIHETH